MKGADVREKLKTSRYTMSEIADKLGISPQTLNSIFNSADVKSGVLEKLSTALNVPLSFFYGEAYGSVQIHGNHIATGDNTVNGNNDRLLNLLVSKDEQLTMAMKQTSKAQEQMDRVLDKFCGKVEG